MSYFETTRIAYADTTAVDAFGKLRATSPRTSETPVSLGSNVAGDRDVLILAVELLSGSSKNFYGAVNWVEIR